MRLSKLRGLPAIESRVARQAGVISDVLVDPHTSRVVAITIEHGDGWLTEQIPAWAVARLSKHAALIHSRDEMDQMLGGIAEDAGVAHPVVGLPVLSEEGAQIGRIGDVHLDPKSLAIVAYELAGPFWSRWLGQARQFRPEDVKSCSAEMMIVRDGHDETARLRRKE